MIRDVLSTETRGTNVTENWISQNIIEQSNITEQSSSRLSITNTTDTAADTGVQQTQHSNRTRLVGEQIYDTYDPEVGINTATVLGGFLVFLVLYVIYRTKCRKRLLAGLQKCTMKYFPEEFPQTDNNTQCKMEINTENNQWISESAKMIWKERANLSRDSVGSPQEFQHEQEICKARRNSAAKRRSSCIMQACGYGEPDNECGLCRPSLPQSEENVELATAQWVQNVKHMDVKERQLNGIVLKIPPELLSHSAKMRSHFHSVTDYTDINDLVNISQRNKSLPLLVEQHTSSRRDQETILREFGVLSSIYVPLASQEDDLDLQPLQLEVKNQEGSTVPLDICPIVTVQHYQSRSKRRLTSICHSSSDDITSSSEEHDATSNTMQKSGSEAKYMRLSTNECFDATINKGISPISNHSKHTGSLETNL